MPDEITPAAHAIEQTGETAWFPPPEDDKDALPPTQEPQRGLRWVFYGAEGLRSGWSILLFVGILLVLLSAAKPLLRWLIPMPKPAIEHPASILIAGDGVSFAALALSAWFVSFVEKRRFSKYGLGTLRGRIGQFGSGCLLGLGMLSALAFLLKISGLLLFTGRLLFGFDVVKWGLLWSIAFLCVGLAEEYAMRGFLQFTVARGIAGIGEALGMEERTCNILGFWLAALFFSFLFGLGHKNNPGESPIGLVSAGLIGLIFAFSLWRTGSLWWAVGFHATWDWGQSFLYGVADSGNMMQHHLLASHPHGTPLMSGGLTGPEGSVYVLVIIAITTLVVTFTLPSQPGSPSDPMYPSRS